MTPAERLSLRNGAINAALWGGVVAFASGGKPAGLLLAVLVAVVAALFSTGVRLPAGLLRDGVVSSLRFAKHLPNASIPSRIFVPLLLASIFAGRGCDGINLPDVKWPDWHLPDVIHVITPDPPAPIPGEGFRVLIVEEATEERSKLPASQQLIFTAKAIRDYAKEHCVTDGFRILDDDADMSREASVWQEAMKAPRASLPWLLVTNGKTGFSGPLPLTVDDTLAILKKYGGA